MLGGSDICKHECFAASPQTVLQEHCKGTASKGYVALTLHNRINHRTQGRQGQIDVASLLKVIQGRETSKSVVDTRCGVCVACVRCVRGNGAAKCNIESIGDVPPVP